MTLLDSPIVEIVLSLLRFVMVFLCVILVARGLMASMRGEPGLGKALLAVLLIGGVGFLVPAMATRIASNPPGADDTDDPGSAAPTSDQASPAPTDEPTGPAADQPASDLSWFLPAAAVLALVVLACLAVLAIGLVHRRAMAAREQRRDVRARWQRIVDQHEDLRRRYLAYETDWDLLFSYPAMIDPSVPSTEKMLRAMQRADQARTNIPAKVEDLDLSSLPFPESVRDFQVAFDAAERHARQVRQNSVPADERKTLRQVRQLLRLAENGGASYQERQTAYRRAMKLLESLDFLRLPERARERIESAQRLLISA